MRISPEVKFSTRDRAVPVSNPIRCVFSAFSNVLAMFSFSLFEYFDKRLKTKE